MFLMVQGCIWYGQNSKILQNILNIFENIKYFRPNSPQRPAEAGYEGGQVEQEDLEAGYEGGKVFQMDLESVDGGGPEF